MWFAFFNFGVSPMLRFIGLLQIVTALPSLSAAKGVLFLVWFVFLFCFFFLVTASGIFEAATRGTNEALTSLVSTPATP